MFVRAAFVRALQNMPVVPRLRTVEMIFMYIHMLHVYICIYVFLDDDERKIVHAHQSRNDS